MVAHFDVAARPAVTEETRELAAEVGDDVDCERLEQDVTSFVGRFSPLSEVKEDQQIRVAIDTRALHLFDPETARAIYQ